MLEKFLIREEPLLFSPTLAKALGINEAVILQQIHYWVGKKLHYFDQRYWTYNTYAEWRKQFPWLSENGIKGVIKKLEKLGILDANNYNKWKFDRTKWYSINYEVLNSFEFAIVENSPTMGQRVADEETKFVHSDGTESSRTIPKTTKTTTNNIFIKPSAQEVTEYAKSINYTLNGNQFIDFYESKDWFIGKNKMKDWKASVRTWRNNELKNGKTKIPEHLKGL